MTSTFIAKRYLFSRNTRNAVNFISFIALLGFAVGTFALVVVMSVFNGFELVINQLYNTYDPDVKIIAAEGKFFAKDNQLYQTLANDKHIYQFSFIIEENGLIRYDNRQTIATIKGVDASYFKVSEVGKMVTDGDTNKIFIGKYAMFGRGLAAKLGIDFTGIAAANIYMPDKSSSPMDAMGGGFTEETLMPTHEFSIQQELDGNTLIIPLQVMQNLIKDENIYSAIEIKLNAQVDAASFTKELRKKIGASYIVKDRYEQHELLNRIMKSEKNVSFILLAFILIIVSFNLTSGLIMLVLEKRDNIKTLKSIGASNQLIKNIFLAEGLYICLIGTCIGLALGYIVCQLQISYGIIPIGDAETLVISSYPVAMKAIDFVLVFVVALVIGGICSYIPAVKATKVEVSD